MNRFSKSLSEYRLDTIAFLYLLGSYQAITTKTNQSYFKLTAKTPSLENKIKNCMKTVFGVDFSLHRHAQTGSMFFTVCSLNLIKFLDELTKGNTSIPLNSVRIKKKGNNGIYEYIRGFFDQRATVTYNPRKFKRSRISRELPFIQITKTNKEVLSELTCLLKDVGISPSPIHERSRNYKYYLIRITKRRDIKRIIYIPLFSSQEKLGKLRELHSSLDLLMKDDKYGQLERRILNINEHNSNLK